MAFTQEVTQLGQGWKYTIRQDGFPYAEQAILPAGGGGVIPSEKAANVFADLILEKLSVGAAPTVYVEEQVEILADPYVVDVGVMADTAKLREEASLENISFEDFCRQRFNVRS